MVDKLALGSMTLVAVGVFVAAFFWAEGDDREPATDDTKREYLTLENSIIGPQFDEPPNCHNFSLFTKQDIDAFATYDEIRICDYVMGMLSHFDSYIPN